MKKLIIGFLAVMAGPVVAGPFGINMGDPIGEVIGTNNEGIPFALLPETQVPNGFELIAVYGTPSTGACAIKAAQKVDNASSWGDEVWAKADILIKYLTNKYGKPPTSIINFLRASSFWKKLKYWIMTSLHQNGRVYAFSWSNLPAEKNDNVTSIDVEASRVSSDSDVITLSYRFANIEKCLSEGATKIESIL